MENITSDRLKTLDVKHIKMLLASGIKGDQYKMVFDEYMKRTIN